MEIGLIGAPIWQGQAIAGVNEAPFVLRRAGLVEQLAKKQTVRDYGDIFVAAENRDKDTDVVRRATAVAASVARLRDKVDEVLQAGQMPVVLGGDHSMAIGTLAAMLRRYPRLGVVWFDAHADINTAETSPSGNAHGMPLAAAMGLGDPRLTAIGAAGARLEAKNLVYVGLRDIDPGEQALIDAQGIRFYAAADVQRLGMRRIMEEVLQYLAHCDGIHLSFDYDGLDPAQFAAVGTPVAEGMSLADGRILLEALGSSGRLLSAEFVEYNPVIAPAAGVAATAAGLIGNLFGVKTETSVQKVLTGAAQCSAEFIRPAFV